MSAPTINRLRLELSESLYNEYEKQAQAAGKPLEEYLVQRLLECKDMDSHGGRSLKLSPTERQFIEAKAGHGFKTGSDVAQYIEYATSLKIGGLTVTLPKDLLHRLETRAVRQTFDKFLPELVIKQLEHFVGLR